MRTEPDEDNPQPPRFLKVNPNKNKKLISFYHLKGLLNTSKTSTAEQNTKDWISNCLNFGTQHNPQEQNDKISLSYGLLSRFESSLPNEHETSFKGVQTPSSHYNSTNPETQNHSRCKTEQFQSRISHSFCKTVIDTHFAQIKLKSRSNDQKPKKQKKILIKLESKKQKKSEIKKIENQEILFRSIGKVVKTENAQSQ